MAEAETFAPSKAKATLRFARHAPRKMRQVAELIRGKQVEDALTALQFCRRSAAPSLEKLDRSAVANAENNHELDVDRLVVTEARVDEGPTLKRFQARAQGRAFRIRKRTSHVTVVLTEQAED